VVVAEKYSTKVQSTSTIIASSQIVRLSPPYAGRYYLGFQDVGTGPVSIRFGSSSIIAGGGLTLSTATSPGGQDGSWEFLDAIPTNSIWAYSTVSVLEAKS